MVTNNRTISVISRPKVYFSLVLIFKWLDSGCLLIEATQSNKIIEAQSSIDFQIRISCTKEFFKNSLSNTNTMLLKVTVCGLQHSAIFRKDLEMTFLTILFQHV